MKAIPLVRIRISVKNRDNDRVRIRVRIRFRVDEVLCSTTKDVLAFKIVRKFFLK